MTNKRIDWEVFFGDSSSEEAICLFAVGKLSFKEFSNNCSYSKERKITIKYLKHIGYKKSIINARKALNRRGFIYSDYKNELRDY